MKTILFTGGGSAGHVIPNIALIEEILSKNIAKVCYMGTDGIEKRLVERYRLPYYTIACPKLVRGGGFKSLKRNLRIPFDFVRAKKQALAGLKALNPDLVFSKGGYVALPVIAAAHKLGIPCLAHESDYSAGLANRLSAKWCESLFTSFPETAENFKNGKYSGAPIRPAIFSSTKAEARKKFRIPLKEKVLLVFGGGSGSAAINEAVHKNLNRLTEKYFILHVCGKGNLVDSREKRYLQFEFIEDMGMAYACADGVVSRAGSGTVFEILALKKPALFVPLEGQTRGDQAENADYFNRQGLCRVLKQSELSSLAGAVDLLFQDEDLKRKLENTDFGQGNEVLLREIRRIINA